MMPALPVVLAPQLYALCLAITTAPLTLSASLYSYALRKHHA